MAVPIPVLDDRKFEDLMAEAISLIPRYNQKWTNYNPSDPGIAILEIFAWISESIIYRTDRITDQTYWKYLSLIGETRKLTTWFQDEFKLGDLLIAGGEIKLIDSLSSHTQMSIHNALEQDLLRQTEFSGLQPVVCPTLVNINGKVVQGIDEEFFNTLTEGTLIVADRLEIGIVQSKATEGSVNVLYMHMPFSAVMNEGEKVIAAILTDVPETPSGHTPASGLPLNTIRVRGRHVLGEGTEFKKQLKKGDVIIARGHARVISDVKSDVNLTVHMPFLEDVDHPIGYHFVRPEAKTGTLVTNGTNIIGNAEDEELNVAKLRAITYVSEAFRAVTVEDYQGFSEKAVKDLIGENETFRTICLNNSNYEWTAIGTQRPGHITIFLVIQFRNNILEAGERSKKILNEISKPVLEALESGLNDGISVSIAEGYQSALKSALILSKGAEQSEKIKQAALEILRQKIINHVESNLDPRRILTTRVHAVFPKLKKVTVKAILTLVKGVNADSVISSAEQALHRFLDPISGGSHGKGWPLGRNLYRSEVFQVLEGLKGVDYVYELFLEDENQSKKDYRFVILEENEFFDLNCTITIKRV